MTIPSAPERLYGFVVAAFPTGTPVPFPKCFQVHTRSQISVSRLQQNTMSIFFFFLAHYWFAACCLHSDTRASYPVWKINIQTYAYRIFRRYAKHILKPQKTSVRGKGPNDR